MQKLFSFVATSLIVQVARAGLCTGGADPGANGCCADTNKCPTCCAWPMAFNDGTGWKCTCKTCGGAPAFNDDQCKDSDGCAAFLATKNDKKASFTPAMGCMFCIGERVLCQTGDCSKFMAAQAEAGRKTMGFGVTKTANIVMCDIPTAKVTTTAKVTDKAPTTSSATEVKGSLTITVANVALFLKDTALQGAMKIGIADFLGSTVKVADITVVVSAVSGRRLSGGDAKMDYVVKNVKATSIAALTAQMAKPAADLEAVIKAAMANPTNGVDPFNPNLVGIVVKSQASIVVVKATTTVVAKATTGNPGVTSYAGRGAMASGTLTIMMLALTSNGV